LYRTTVMVNNKNLAIANRSRVSCDTIRWGHQ